MNIKISLATIKGLDKLEKAIEKLVEIKKNNPQIVDMEVEITAIQDVCEID